MPKVLVSLAILLIGLFNVLLWPETALATDDCASKFGIIVTLDAPDAPGGPLLDQASITTGNGTNYGINVKIPLKNSNPGWEYYPIMLAESFLTGSAIGTTELQSAYSAKMKDSSATTQGDYKIFHWDMDGSQLRRPTGGSDYTEYRVRLKHAEGTTPGVDICDGPAKQLKTVNRALTEVASCPITLSDNFNIKDPVTGSVTLKDVTGVKYIYGIGEGNLTSQVPTDPYKYNLFRDTAKFTAVSTEEIPAGTTTLPAKTGLEFGKTYTATVFAVTTTAFPADTTVACGTRVFTVNNDTTSPPTTGGDISLTPGLGGGVPGIVGGAGGSGVDCTTTPDKCSTAAGKTCDTSQGNRELLPIEAADLQKQIDDARKGGDTKTADELSKRLGVYTAIGCIPTDPGALVGALLKFAAGGAGGIALLLMIFGAFRMVTSAGNEESLKAGKEQFSSAIIGLLFIIFAVLLLQIIGVDILGLPGFK